MTNGGYWDYSGWGRRHMEGWQGSNAPHLLGEGVEQPRHARVVIYGYNDDAAFLELERKSADDTRFTREIVSLSAGLWLVVDEARSPVGSQVETLWTFFPDMSIEMTGSDSYLVRDGSSTQMFVGLWAEQALQTELYRGNQSPFAGWGDDGARRSSRSGFTSGGSGPVVARRRYLAFTGITWRAS